MEKDIIEVKKIFKENNPKRIFGENIVIEYQDYFYKTPNFVGKIMNHSSDKYENITKNIELIRKYFGGICEIAPTEIIKDDDLFFIIKQKKIPGSILKVNDLKNKEIKEKLQKIMDINQIFWEKEGYFLDVFGTDVVINPQYIHNLILFQNEIYIFDFGVLDRNSSHFIFRMLSHFFYHLQMNSMKVFLKNL